ncbi:hypothetical protein CgunFtcFv8_003741 [Champsocephalus gunnari]|uniref:Uncharacterized protein n=1 Tax=Champsocephalus gunnari TaxID=52237 RepID=A0AAN8HXH8_CHAGU|nr:hypothetical protein CgunFtcFv8_003741 [Champsocephalus gunnari]
MQHMFRSVTSCTKCASIHRLISSLQHSEGEGSGLSQGHRALHHCGMMGSSCPGQAASQPRTARVCLASPTLTERREEGTGAPLPLCNWYQMVPLLLGPDLSRQSPRTPQSRAGGRADSCLLSVGPRTSKIIFTHTHT